MTSFERSVGAPFDVKELEYIAALHQTCTPQTRINGTVSSMDIMRFFRSRFGFRVPHSFALSLVRTFGGGHISEELLSKILLREEQEEEATNLLASEQRKRRLNAENLKLAAICLRGKISRGNEAQEVQEVQEEPQIDNNDKADNIDIDIDIDLETKGHKVDENFFDIDAESDSDSVDEDPDLIDVDDPEEYLDLVQLLSILLIPTLNRAASEVESPPAPPANRSDSTGIDNLDSRSHFQKSVANDKAADEEFQSLRPQPTNLLADSLRFLLRGLDLTTLKKSSNHGIDANEEDWFPDLTTDLVVKLLQAHGEYERAQDPELVQAMVYACGSSTVLNEDAWIKALTGDVQQWEVGCEDRISTHIYDVWGFDSYKEWSEYKDEQEDKQQVDEELEEVPPQRRG